MTRNVPGRAPKIKKTVEGYLWLLPFMIPYCIFTLWMLIQTVSLSFQDYSLMKGGVFNGIAN